MRSPASASDASAEARVLLVCTETRRTTKQRQGVPGKRGGRRRSAAEEEEEEEPLPIIEHELDAQPSTHEVGLSSHRCTHLLLTVSDIT